MSSNVEPFPIRACRHFLDMMRCNVLAQPTATKRKAMLRQIIAEHRRFLTDAGVEPGLIDREIRDLEMAISPPPTTTNGGMRMAA